MNVSSMPRSMDGLPFDIFRYSSSADLLLAYIEHKRSTTRYFSISGWARKLELPTSGILVNILKRRRLPHEELAHKLVRSMELKALEAEYFFTLIAWERSKQGNGMSGSLLRRRLDSLIRRAETEVLDEARANRTTTVPHLAVKELLGLQEAPTSAEGIRDRLRAPLNQSDVEGVLHTLLESGLIEALPNGGFRPVARNIESGGDVPSSAVRGFHRESLQNAARALDSIPMEERHFTSYIMPITRDRLPAAKEAIETFLDEFSGEFEAPSGTGDDVYQLNIQYVPLTQSRGSSS